jgi:hypothetical protein
MSLPFNDLSNYRGIVQLYEEKCLMDSGFISGNTERLKRFTAKVNLAWDRFMQLAISASGTWQFDDSNHDDYPTIFTNLVSGQRSYSFVGDEQGNLILDIYKVLVADESGYYREILPVDKQTSNSVNLNTDTFSDGQNKTGTPTRYDKTANGIFLDLVPSYNYTNGLQVMINREPSYFVYTDTTKKPGVPGLFHSYFYLHPARDYAESTLKSNFNLLDASVQRMEMEIIKYFNNRQRDVKKQLKPNIENTQ